MSRLIIILLLFLNVSGSFSQTSVEQYIAELNECKDDSTRGSLCHKISLKYYSVNNQKAMDYAIKSQQYFKQSGYEGGEGFALQMQGYIFMELGENAKALEAFKESILFLEKSKKYTGAVVSYSGASYCLERAGKLEEALKLVIRSLEIIEEQNLPESQRAKNLVDLARIYRQNNQPQKSIEVYEEALDISVKAADHSTSGIILMNMGNVYAQTKEYKLAVQHLKRALIETKACKCNGRLSPVWSNLGFAQYYLNNKSEVEIAAKNAEKHLIDTSNLEAYMDIIALKGMNQQMRGNYTEAISLLEKSLYLAKQIDAKEKIVMISDILNKSYGAIGEYQKINDLVADAVAAKDSMYNAQSAKSMAEMQIKYETEKKQLALEQADLQNQLNEKHIKQINQRNFYMAIFLFTTAVLAVFSLYFLQKSRKTAHQLSVQNKELALLLEQKKTLLKEIHHRVKNNLQTVSSLLNLQTRSSNDAAIKKAMNEGQSRLKSISLLHQKLYQNEALTKVEMDDYIDDLGNYIIKNFNESNKKITLKTQSHDISLDLDTAIPLGLIINELITNSIKHSFKNINEGEIDISISKLDNPNLFELKITNNGIGLPKDTDLEKISNMGLKLVRSLSRQIHGKFETFVDSKSHFVVNFSETIS